jgi:hypothetical protein
MTNVRREERRQLCVEESCEKRRERKKERKEMRTKDGMRKQKAEEA